MSRRPQLRRQRWYRLLLLAYPRAWRHERGAELRTTLLEAAQTQPGRRPPALREAASLLVGGLRTRTRMAAAGSVGRLWHSGLHLGALLLLLSQAAAALHTQWAELAWARSQHTLYPPSPLALLPILGALSVLRGRLRVGLVLTALTAAVAFSPAATNINIGAPPGSWGTAAGYLLPIAIVGLLAWQRPPPQPRSWLWLLVPVLVALDATATGYVINDTGGQVTWLLLPALLLGALALAPVDPRPAIGATVFLAPQLAKILEVPLATRQPIGVLLWAGGTLALLLAAIWGTRRLTRA
ncbi:MAG TPA: hypothetical protein VG276_04485 [Actinomycetes bacterium]|jgi:hypothetical protein|nr:hypothetical protein [Actinomycetes bacterium]